ncbi:MAG: hypothetical protein WCG66_11885 [bacterium]
MLGYPNRQFLRQRFLLSKLLFRKKLIFLVLAVVPIVAISAGFVWLFPKLKARQSQEFFKAAESYVQAGDIRNGVVCLKSSLRLMPGNPEALSLLARIQSSQGEPTALETWSKLLATGKVQLEDIGMYAQAAANHQDWALANRLTEVTAIAGNKALPHLIRAGLLQAKGEPDAVESELRQAVEVDQSQLSKRALAKFLMSRTLNEARAREAYEILREISKTPDVTGAEALTTALLKGLVPASDMPAWIAAIRANPKISLRGLCLADYTESLSGFVTPQVAASRIKQRVEKSSVTDRAEAMQWLLRLGEQRMASDLLTPGEAEMSESIYYSWLDANSAAAKWDVVLKSLDGPGNPIKEPFLVCTYRASVFQALGRKEEAQALFLSAYEQAHADNTKFLKCLAVLNTAQQDALFEKGFREVLSNPETASASFKALLPSTYLRRDSLAALRFYETAAEVSPQLAGDMALQNDLFYLKVLTGRTRNVGFAENLSKANPLDQSLRVTYAFAKFQSGNPDEALKILEASEQGIAASSLRPHEKAVVASILAANGRRKDAEVVARLVQPNQLSIQEIQLVQNQFQNVSQNAPSPASGPVNPPPKATKTSKTKK